MVMTKTRTARTISATGNVYLIIGVLGLKFKCLVQREWPCEAMIATAIAEYHLAYPACEIPDFNAIYHTERKEFLKFSESIGAWCADNDEIELSMTEKSVLASPSANAGAQSVASSGGSSSEDRRELFDFMIMFHRLPLGFTLKQNNEHIVVANIYPHSTATHYERLETGVTVVRIANTLLENLGLRQVHDLIKNAKIPLEIHFRGYKKPSLRASLLLAAAQGPVPSQIPMRRRSVSSPKPEDDGSSPPPPSSSACERARTTSGATSSTKRTVELVKDATDARQRQPLTGKRSSARSCRSSQESTIERELLTGDNQNNDSSNGPGRSAAAPRRVRQLSSSSGAVEEGELENEEPTDVQLCDEDSNQNEDDTEELLVDQIKTLQTALLKKHEEAKQIARQIELFHEKLASMRSKNSSGTSGKAQPQQDNTELETGEPSIAPPPRSLKRRPSSTTSLKLRLTPEVLEAMDSKAGVPPKTAAFYQSSNVSSVSGYSNYSSRSNAAAPRSGPRTTSVRRSESNNMRSDASVTSHSSATSERRQSQSNPRSPRSQCVKNINNRYSYIPQKYTANASSSAEAPTSSSLSSRGAVMSRAKATRDSFIVKSESPGVGYYDVKLPTSHVRGGEIGDSGRSLPWP